MNDYNCENGYFKQCEYVHVSRIETETGSVYSCQCKIYKTIVETSSNHRVSELEMLDNSSSVKCLHCRLFSEEIAPNIVSLFSQSVENYFDESTGLLEFPCLSSHAPRQCDDPAL